MKFAVSVEQPGPPVKRTLVDVGDAGVKFPRVFTVHVYDHEDGDPDVDLVFEVRDGAPQCREVHIRATDNGHEVRSSGLAGLRVQDVMELAVKHMALVYTDDTGRLRMPLHPTEEQLRDAVRSARTARRTLRMTVTEDLLREVAEVYRANVRDRPTMAVEAHFGVRPRTAANYVQRAREAGFLPPTTRGKAKA